MDGGGLNGRWDGLMDGGNLKENNKIMKSKQIRMVIIKIIMMIFKNYDYNRNNK